MKELHVEIRDLTCGWSKEVPVIRHMNLTLSDHEICCVLGPNGVGKTTFFKTFLRFLPKISGKILIDGEDVQSWSPGRLARTVAYVAQNHVPPFPYLVKDVVLLGRVGSTGYFKKPGVRDVELAEAAMHDMGVFHLRDKSYTDISGGERQLVMLARALTQQPRLLVLDEPTANLDYGNQVRVLEKIITLRDSGYGVLMTTHAPEHAFLCDASVVLLRRDGPLLSGSAPEVLTEKNLKEVYGVPVRVVEHFADGKLMRLCAPVLQG